MHHVTAIFQAPRPTVPAPGQSIPQSLFTEADGADYPAVRQRGGLQVRQVYSSAPVRRCRPGQSAVARGVARRAALQTSNGHESSCPGAEGELGMAATTWVTLLAAASLGEWVRQGDDEGGGGCCPLGVSVGQFESTGLTLECENPPVT